MQMRHKSKDWVHACSNCLRMLIWKATHELFARAPEKGAFAAQRHSALCGSPPLQRGNQYLISLHYEAVKIYILFSPRVIPRCWGMCANYYCTRRKRPTSNFGPWCEVLFIMINRCCYSVATADKCLVVRPIQREVIMKSTVKLAIKHAIGN